MIYNSKITLSVFFLYQVTVISSFLKTKFWELRGAWTGEKSFLWWWWVKNIGLISETVFLASLKLPTVQLFDLSQLLLRQRLRHLPWKWKHTGLGIWEALTKIHTFTFEPVNQKMNKKMRNEREGYYSYILCRVMSRGVRIKLPKSRINDFDVSSRYIQP